MIEVRPRATLGSTRSHCLDALHHFSFAGYADPNRDGLGRLSVVNHTVLAARSDLGPQPLDGVDVITFVRRGVVEQMGFPGKGCRTVAGEVQFLSTGQGIAHGYRNPGSRSAEYLELRLRTEDRNCRPGRTLAAFPTRGQTDRCVVLASGWSEDRAPMRLHCPARVSAMRLRGGAALTRSLERRLHGYVLCVSGRLEVNGAMLVGRDAAVLRGEADVHLRASAGSEIILVETE